MKVRSARKIPQANKMFTDREEPRQTFWKQYKLMKSQMDDIADIKVISFYGIGGVGKSSLLKKIIEESEDKVNTPNYTYFDLGVMNESKAVLEGMRNKLSEDYKYSFPIFDLALYTYARKIGKTPESAEIKTFASKSPFLSLVMDVGQVFPGIGTISQIIATADKGVAYVRNILNNHRKEITEMETMSADELYAKLPYLFSLDMSDNLQNAKEPFVVFLDTYEKLVNEMSSIGEPLNNDLWLRDENGLIQNIPNVLWVIAGREKLKWTRFDTEWNDALEQHILGSLSYTDASNFLYHAGIKDNSLIADIYELTHGTPIYLDLCVDRYISVSQTKTPTIDDFGKDTFTLIERFVRYMDDNKKDIVYMLSCLGIWEEELISKIASKIIPNFSITSYEKVKDFSFLSESSDGIFTMHQTVSEVLFSSCPDIIKTRTVENALEYYISKLNSTELFAERFSFYLDMTVKMSLLKYPDNDDYFDYYKDNLNDIFENLTDACKFDMINNAFNQIFQRAKKEPTSKLYALSLRAKARFIMFEGKYKESIPYAEESIRIFENTLGENNEDTLESKFRLGWCLYRQGMYKESNELANTIYEQCLSTKGEDNILAVKILNLKASTLDSLGKYEEALKLYKMVLEKRTEILGENHHNTLGAMENLAGTLNSLGRYEESLELKKQVLEKRTEILGENHPDTISSMSSLAVTLNSLGRYEESLTLRKQVLEKRTEILGENHPDTISSMSSLAVTLNSLGRYEESLSLKKQVLEKRTEILGENHPDTISSMNSLATTLNNLGKYEESLELKKQVLEKRTEILGENHPDTISSMNSLATTLNNLGKYEESLELKKQVLEKRTEILGENHPDTISAMSSLATTLNDLGKYEESLELKKQVLEKRTEILGENHPDTIRAMNNLAVTLNSLGRYEESLTLRKQVLEKRTEILGENHPNTIRSMSSLATTLNDLGRYEDSLTLRKQVLEKRTEILGEDHPNTISSMNSLATTLNDLGRYEDSLTLRKQVLEKRTEILGENHPDTIGAVNKVAWTYYCMGKFQEGLPYAEKLLTLVEKSDTHNKNRLTRLDTIALLFAETGKIEQALQIAEEIISESENQYYDISDFMGNRYKTMGIVLAKAEKYNEAVAYFNKALEHYNKSGVKTKEIDECKTLIKKYEQM